MKKDLIWIALAALLLPLLVRAIWFYPGVPAARPAISTPDYVSMKMPASPLQTPDPNEKVSTRSGVVVIDYYHANQFQTPEIESLIDAVTKRGASIELANDATTLETRLKYASAYVVISPSTSFSIDEIRSVKNFVARGGRLVVFTDATRGTIYNDFSTGATYNYPDVNITNPLLAPYGITVHNDYLYNLAVNEGNFRNIYFDTFGKNELTFGLKKVAFYGTHSVKTDSGLILLKGVDQTFSSITDAHDPAAGGAALSDDGNVLVFGDFTFLASPYNIVGDNSTLIDNIADYLLSGKRTPTLATFPYVFSQPVLQVFPTSKVQLTAEMIASLGKLQTSLHTVNVNLQIATKEPSDGDKLILGTFTPSDDLTPFLEPFNLTLDDTSEFVDVPGFGKIGQSGNSILLFDTSKTGTTLVLLADTVDDLTLLLDTISSGSLSGCVLQGKIGVCSTGVGGSFSDGSTASGTTTAEPKTSETPATATPVPSGG